MTNLLFFAAVLAAQEPTTIRVTTRMVEVSVVVRDAGGRAVTGLRAEDFHLVDGGREEQIRSFIASVPGQRTGPGEPGVYANQPGTARPRVATVILFDYLNSTAENESFGRGELLGFLRELEPQTPVALVKLDVGFKVLHDFTTDAESLAGALERHRPYHSVWWAGFQPFQWHGPPVYKRAGRGSFSQVGSAGAATDSGAEAMKAVFRASQTGSAAAALASYLSRVPGRKNLIWISSVFPAALAAQVRSDDVAIYPVDVRTPIEGPTKAAQFLAASTGGVAFDHGNHVRQAIQQAYEDSSATYVLGYYPSHGQWNGRFRPIQVSVNRPGMEVRHRAGYRAAIEEDFGPRRAQEILWDAVSSPAEVAGIGLRLSVKQQERGTLALKLAIDSNALSGGPAGGNVNEMELLLAPLRVDGSALPASYCTFKVAAGPPGRDVTLSRSITPPPEAHKIRVVVRDTRTGALGTVTVPLRPAGPGTHDL